MRIKKYPTGIGYIALLFWVLAAPFAAHVRALPLFEALTITFCVSFTLSAIKFTVCGHWYRLKQPLIVILLGFIGVYGNQVFFVASFKYAPAAHADLINYLWPILVLIFTGLLPNERFDFRQVIAACCGFMGVYVLLFKGASGFDSHYLLGYFFAFAGAVVWAVYSLSARFFAELPVEIVGLYCGLAMLFSFIIHISNEPTVMPQASQWATLILMGITTQGLAYFFWDFAVKKGDFKRLSLLSYANPILSIFFLILLGTAKPTVELAIACLLVSAGGAIGIIPWTLFNQMQWRGRRRRNLTALVTTASDQSTEQSYTPSAKGN